MKSKSLISLVTILCLTILSCGQTITYINGEKYDSWSIGTIDGVPENYLIRTLGEEFAKSWLSFSYMNDSDIVISPLSFAQKEFNIKDGVSNLGKPEKVGTKDEELGIVEYIFGSGCIGKLDLAKNLWIEWEMASYVPYAPPVPTAADLEVHRELEDEIAISISADFLSVIGYSLGGYKAEIIDEFSIGGKTVLFREVLVDTNIDSPNWIKVNVDFWGFIRSFSAKVDKTPIISTKPTITEQEAREIVRGLQNLSESVDIPRPNRAIKRVRTVENLGQAVEQAKSYVKQNIVLTDTLVWHFDFFGVDYSVKNMSLSIDAHTGEKLD